MERERYVWRLDGSDLEIGVSRIYMEKGLFGLVSRWHSSKNVSGILNMLARI